jgi:Family of unknown function (DUF5706)
MPDPQSDDSQSSSGAEAALRKPVMYAPAEFSTQGHIGDSEAFAGIVGRNVSDYLMQTAQRHHMQLSQMADNKASMLITVSSLVLTVSISRFNDPQLRNAILVLSGFTLAALLMAILAVLPKYRPLKLEDPNQLPAFFNPIFFAHFSELPRERFFEVLGKTLRHDANVYEVLANDLYSIGSYLARHKYRYLRMAYLFFLTGFISATLVQFLHYYRP